MHDGHLTVEEMMAVAVDFISPQRPWLTTYLDQLVRRAGGAPAESDPEVRIGAVLLAAGISGLERQYPIDLPATAWRGLISPCRHCVGRSRSTYILPIAKPPAS